MENKDKLVNLILNGERRKAETLLSEICRKSPSRKYAAAREKILLVEAAKTLNENIPSFYVDVNLLAEELFEEKISAGECSDRLCRAVKSSVKSGRLESVAKARDFITAKLTENQLSVGLVADYTGLTQSELIKLFKENEGITPGDYIGKKRAEESISYLKNNVSVEKVALMTGFSSVEAYIRTFRKHMGLTPGVWKKKNL